MTKLYDLGSADTVTSVHWSADGANLAVGTDLGVLQIWDVNKGELVRTMEGHFSRIGVMHWTEKMLSSGS